MSPELSNFAQTFRPVKIQYKLFFCCVLYILYFVLSVDYGACEQDDDSIEDAKQDDVFDDLDEESACMTGFSGVDGVVLFL